MGIYKDKEKGTWRVIYRYVDWTGERKQTQKRGFATRREAQQWEHEQMLQKVGKLDMTFGAFFKLYEEDRKARVRENTWDSKGHIIRTKILPYFENRKMDEIDAKDIIGWQNVMLQYRDEKGKPYSPNYLKTMQSQLSAIFNYAVRVYNLPSNPVHKAGPIAREEFSEMKFWTKEEYLRFSDAMMDKPVSYYAFQMLYWCGIRMGELLALTPADFDFKEQTVSINKSYQRLKGKDIITPPKTKKSKRLVKMPKFLCDEMEEYMTMLYEIKKRSRLFQITKSYLHHEMDRGSKQAEVKRIRVHDLRHSHISLLIDMGFTVLAIGERVGHEAEKITYRYAHLFPTVQAEMAEKLELAGTRREDSDGKKVG